MFLLFGLGLHGMAYGASRAYSESNLLSAQVLNSDYLILLTFKHTLSVDKECDVYGKI